MLTDDQVRSLPLWVAVGFAAHCAQVVLPAFREGYPAAPNDVLAALKQAVSIAGEFASRGAGTPGYAAEADGDHAVDVAVAARRWATNPEVVNYSDAAAGAAYAAGAAADVVEGRPWASRELVYSNVTRAINGAWQNHEAAVRLAVDFSQLVDWVRAAHADDSSPYPASPFHRAPVP